MQIYINGHSGEIKIGDLGLASLLPKRFPEGEGRPFAALIASMILSDLCHCACRL